MYIQCTEFQNPIYKTKSYTFFQNKYSQTHAKCSRNTLVFRNVSGSPKDDKNVKRLGAIQNTSDSLWVTWTPRHIFLFLLSGSKFSCRYNFIFITYSDIVPLHNPLTKVDAKSWAYSGIIWNQKQTISHCVNKTCSSLKWKVKIEIHWNVIEKIVLIGWQTITILRNDHL